MKIFDLHCDTIGECYNEGLALRSNNLHLSLERAKKYENYTQLFAVWIPDEKRGNEAVEYFNNVSDCFYNEIQRNSDLISLYSSENATPIKAILTVEGGSACGGTIEGLRALYEKGVKVITLTWNGTNEIASGALVAEGGFTDFGREFIKIAEDLGIILDVSHLNKQSFFEFVEISTKPFIASHSNADIVNNPYAHKRNLTDEQIDIIRERGGIIGLNYYKAFLENEGIYGVDALAQQIEYFISKGCGDIIALGSDYDGCRINDELCGVEKLDSVYEKLLTYGFTKEVLDKLFFINAHNFFEGKI